MSVSSGCSEPSQVSRACCAATISVAVEQLQQRFLGSPHLELRSVRVREHDGIVRLEGHVTSFYAKQAAQLLAGHASRIENAIDVA